MTPKLTLSVAQRIAKRILSDVTDRKGWDDAYDQFDAKVRAEIEATWVKKIEKELNPWRPPETIALFPELHSTSLIVKPLLIVTPRSEYPQIGWYHAGLLNEWYLSGSPSTPEVICWMPMPTIPSLP